MQEHTNKESDVRTRSTTPIHTTPTTPTTRQAIASADTLREVHMSLVRAEQNLYNLVQASQGAPSPFAFAPGAYPVAGYAAPAFPPGFASVHAVSQPAFGFAPQPNGMGHAPAGYGQPAAFAPSANPQWSPPANQWSPLATVAALPGVIAAGLSAISGALAASVATLPTSASVPALSPGFATNAWAQGSIPACDISDEGKAFVCHLDLPGLRADQVELVCLEQAIVVSAIREANGEAVTLVQAERGIATQQRTIVLPAPIQPGGAKASLGNGILTVTLPKVNPTEGPRRIKVQG